MCLVEVDQRRGAGAYQLIEPRVVHLTNRTGITVRRTLPTRQLRTIGAWCFIDHFGPYPGASSMSVAPHPHVGLQTVSWLFAGEVEHRDSLSTVQVITPGALNLMTAGRGIAHSELSDPDSPAFHGVQLWVALPDGVRHQAPHFEHHAELPEFDCQGARIRLLVGTLLGNTSVATIYSPLVGAQITLGRADLNLPLEPGFQYGILAVDSDIRVNGLHVPATQLLSIDEASRGLRFSGPSGARFMLLGGEPFNEPLVMWWNFIGRSHEEIVQMRQDWQEGSERFAAFTDRIGGRIPAPELPIVPLRPRYLMMRST